MTNQGAQKDKKSGSIIRKMMKCLIVMWCCTTLTFTTIYLLQKNYPYFYILLNSNQISKITQQQITLDEQQQYLRKIPRIIHQTYIDRASLPAKWKKMSKTCKKLHPNWEYRFYSDKDMYKFVRKYYPEQEENFLAYPHTIQRVDAFRYMLLHHYGGVYLDFDVGCKRSLEPFLIYPVALPETKPLGISNDVLFSAKAHPFFERAISSLPTWNYNYMGLKYLTVMISTGPLFLSAQLSSYYYYLFSDDYYYDQYGDETTILNRQHQMNAINLDRKYVQNNNNGEDDDDHYGIPDYSTESNSDIEDNNSNHNNGEIVATNGGDDDEHKNKNEKKMQMYAKNNNNGGNDGEDDRYGEIIYATPRKWNDFFFNEDEIDAINYLNNDNDNEEEEEDEEEEYARNYYDDNENDNEEERKEFEERRQKFYFDDDVYYRDMENNNAIVRKREKDEGIYVIEEEIYAPSSRSYFKHVRGKSWHGDDAYYIFVIQEYLYILPYLIVVGIVCVLFYIFSRCYFSSSSSSTSSRGRFIKS